MTQDELRDLHRRQKEEVRALLSRECALADNAETWLAERGYRMDDHVRQVEEVLYRSGDCPDWILLLLGRHRTIIAIAKPGKDAPCEAAR